MPNRPPNPFLVPVFVVALLTGCEASTGPGSVLARSPESTQDLIPYDGPMRVLFDDTIDVEVFSGSEVSFRSIADLRLIERIRSSAFLVQVVVVTVTDQHEQTLGHMDLELQPVGRPLHGTLAPHIQPGEPIRLELGPSSAGYAMIRANQNELVGKRLNFCWNRFAEGTTSVAHWHAFADTPKTKQAVEKAAAIVNFD